MQLILPAAAITILAAAVPAIVFALAVSGVLAYAVIRIMSDN